jgi:hypothetical protein
VIVGIVEERGLSKGIQIRSYRHKAQKNKIPKAKKVT